MENDFFYKINKDYIELKDILDDNDKIIDYFKINENEINNIIVTLRTSKENGFIEARESLLKNIYSVLDDGLYKVLSQDKLETILLKSCDLILITIILRRIYYANIKIKTDKDNKEIYEDAAKLDIKSIVTNLTFFIKQDKSITQNKLYKDIIIRIKNYNSEIAKFNELSKNLTGDKKNQLIENTKKSLSGLLGGIKKNYSSIQEYIYENQQKIGRADELLNNLKFNPVYPIVNEQISSYSRLYSSINYIIEEKSNMLKIVEKIHSKFDDFISLLHKEEQLLINLLIKNKYDSTRIEELINSITSDIIVILEAYYMSKDSD